MLGYIVGAALWGFAKSRLANAEADVRALHSLGLSALLEELQFRWALERVVAPKLGLGTAGSRALGAIAFALAHPDNMLDAALGGLVYSKAYDAGGLKLSTLTHAAHNIGVHLGGR